MEKDKQATDRKAFHFLYGTQEVFKSHFGNFSGGVEFATIMGVIDQMDDPNYDMVLRELTPLSLTDEECLDVMRIVTRTEDDHTVENGRGYIKDAIMESYNTYDLIKRSQSVTEYLRSIDFLMPFRSYTTDQLISMGWVKLKHN
jgi:hypothetical protein